MEMELISTVTLIAILPLFVFLVAKCRIKFLRGSKLLIPESGTRRIRIYFATLAGQAKVIKLFCESVRFPLTVEVSFGLCVCDMIILYFI